MAGYGMVVSCDQETLRTDYLSHIQSLIDTLSTSDLEKEGGIRKTNVNAKKVVDFVDRHT